MADTTIEVYDETADLVFVFPSVSAADVYALTGQSTWTSARPPRPSDRHTVTLSSLS